MTRKRYNPDDPREWLNRARSSLQWARQNAPEIYLEELCFGAQQAAEKAIKGVFVHLGEAFPYTHDLEKLLSLLSQNLARLPVVAPERDVDAARVVAYPSLGLLRGTRKVSPVPELRGVGRSLPAGVVQYAVYLGR